MLNPLRMSVGKAWECTSLYLGYRWENTPVLPPWLLCFCWVHTLLCSGLPPHVHSWLTVWSKEGGRGGPSLTLPGDQIDWCLPSRSPEIPAESWPFTEQHKTSPVSFKAVVAMADPNNIPQLLSPLASSPPPTGSNVGSRRWKLLGDGNLEARKDRKGI